MTHARDLERAQTAAEFFAGMIESYDSLIRRAVPRYEEMTARLVDYMPATAHRILELGCGTGNLSVALLKRYPEAAFTFVDAASDMLELTRTRLAERTGEGAATAQFVLRRFEELSFSGREYDLIVSAISLHHVADRGSLFRALHGAMERGGQLVFSDQMRAAPVSAHQQNWEEWLAFCRLPGHCTEDELASLIAHAAAHDHYATVAQHVQWLEDAGFQEIDCLWRNGMWAIVTATA